MSDFNNEANRLADLETEILGHVNRGIVAKQANQRPNTTKTYRAAHRSWTVRPSLNFCTGSLANPAAKLRNSVPPIGSQTVSW
jgi:hypothetical protein